MGNRMPRARKDDNHDEIVAQFEQLGCSVEETVCTGLPGFPDLMVGCIGVNHLVEVKNPDTAYGRQGLNSNQHQFNARWRGERMWQATTRDDVIALVQAWRRAGK
jgi:hypothetical protein